MAIVATSRVRVYRRELNPNHRQFTLHPAEHKSQHSNAHLSIMAAPIYWGRGRDPVVVSKFEKLAQIV